MKKMHPAGRPARNGKAGILSALFTAALFACHAAGADFRIVYDFEYTKDSVNAIRGKDILYLEISEDSSLCFSYYTYQTDSLRKTPDGRAVWRNLFTAAIAKDGAAATAFPHKRSTFVIAKYRHSDTLSVKDAIEEEIYRYGVPRDGFGWRLCDSARNIGGYEAHMATCTYHGREWTVWFAPDLPFNDGPWVFCGLPGLILEARDRDGLFSFRLLGLSPNRDPKKDWLSDGKRTDRITFLKKQYRHWAHTASSLGAELGISVPHGRDTRYLDGLEPDFR